MVAGFTPPDRPEGGIHNGYGVTKFGDVAYLPGSGPVDKHCSGCHFMVHSRGAKTYGKCEKVAIIRRFENGILDVKYIYRGTRACKFFEPRPEGERPWKRYDDLRDVGDAGSEGDPDTAETASEKNGAVEQTGS